MTQVALLIARAIFAGVFLFAAAMKFSAISDTAGYIALIGFPAPLFFAWAAAILETLLALAFLTGALFVEGAAVSTAYVLFLTLAYHGPSRWEGNPMEFGLFINHLAFIAGLLFAAVSGPGEKFTAGRQLSWRSFSTKLIGSQTA